MPAKKRPAASAALANVNGRPRLASISGKPAAPAARKKVPSKAPAKAPPRRAPPVKLAGPVKVKSPAPLGAPANSPIPVGSPPARGSNWSSMPSSGSAGKRIRQSVVKWTSVFPSIEKQAASSASAALNAPNHYSFDPESQKYSIARSPLDDSAGSLGQIHFDMDFDPLE